MPYIIAEPCINLKDRSCVDVCPVDCIYEGEDQLYIHPDECIDCGACEPECPVTAIFLDVDLEVGRNILFGKNRGDGTLRFTRAAVNAFVRMDVEHVRSLVDAIDRTDVDTGLVLDGD